MAAILPVFDLRGGNARHLLEAPLPAGSGRAATSAAGAGVSIVITNDPTRPVILSQIMITQSATGSAAVLTVTDGVTEMLRVQVPATTPGLPLMTFHPPVAGTPGQDLTVAVTGAGGAVLTSLWVNAYFLR